MHLRDLNWHHGIPTYFVLRERCPLCRATEFHPSVSHPFRSILRFLAIHPVRCQNCWRFYYWLKFSTLRRT